MNLKLQIKQTLANVTNLIHFQVLANADQVEEARADTMKLNNTVQDGLHDLDNTVQDGLHDLDKTVYDLNITVQEAETDIKNITG